MTTDGGRWNKTDGTSEVDLVYGIKKDKLSKVLVCAEEPIGTIGKEN